jgi:hypothetical protein
MAFIFRTFCVPLLLAAPLIFAAPPDPARTTTKVPKPQFQNDYFGEMARTFCTVKEVDLKGRTLVVKVDRDGRLERIAIKDDTELRFRDSWGELENYFPGQHLMLFMYVDEEKKWTYPRAIQDEIQVSAAHGWYAAVTAIDLDKKTYATHREERDKAGKVTKVEDKQYVFDPAVKIWKDATPGGIESLKIGDEVIPQLIEKDGKLVAIEILDRKGDAAVRAAQEEQHRKDQDRLGLAAYVTDIEVISGALTATIAWSGAERASHLKPGDTLAITPTTGSTFAAAIVSSERIDSRVRLHLAINARVAARLAVGESLRVFVPGTGPEIPAGKSGIPASAYK